MLESIPHQIPTQGPRCFDMRNQSECKTLAYEKRLRVCSSSFQFLCFFVQLVMYIRRSLPLFLAFRASKPHRVSGTEKQANKQNNAWMVQVINNTQQVAAAKQEEGLRVRVVLTNPPSCQRLTALQVQPYVHPGKDPRTLVCTNGLLCCITRLLFCSLHSWRGETLRRG